MSGHHSGYNRAGGELLFSGDLIIIYRSLNRHLSVYNTLFNTKGHQLHSVTSILLLSLILQFLKVSNPFYKPRLDWLQFFYVLELKQRARTFHRGKE